MRLPSNDLDVAALRHYFSHVVPTEEAFKALGHEVPITRFISCPAHDDHTPSLRVYEKTRGWFCFSCRRGGTALHFAKLLRPNTTEAALLYLLADKFGISKFRLTDLPKPPEPEDHVDVIVDAWERDICTWFFGRWKQIRVSFVRSQLYGAWWEYCIPLLDAVWQNRKEIVDYAVLETVAEDVKGHIRRIARLCKEIRDEAGSKRLAKYRHSGAARKVSRHASSKAKSRSDVAEAEETRRFFE